MKNPGNSFYQSFKTLPLILAAIFLTLPLYVNAQWQNGLWTGREAYNWCLGSNLGMDFNWGDPTSFGGVQLSAHEGSATISNSEGQLLAYAGGGAIWNANHQIMLNGNGITGSESSTQHGVFIPKPGSPGIYYLFCVNRYDFVTGLTYSEIDFSLDGGLGGVTATKNVVLDPDVAGEKITAVYHSDKQSIWVITHKKIGNEFAAFLVSENGISNPVVSTGGFSYTDPQNSPYPGRGPFGQMKVSPDGAYLATTIYTGPDTGVDLFHFNNLDGTIELITHLSVYPGQLYGIEFSPNSKYLYVPDLIYGSFGGTLAQYDVTLESGEAIQNSKAVVVNLGVNGINIFDANVAMQLGPDGKIYIRNNLGQVLNTINYPNNQGVACGFSLDSFNTSSNFYLGLPTFNQSYFQSGIIAEPLCYGKVLFSHIRIYGAETITWDFGDPASPDNISQSPLHAFTAAGTYTVTATITSNGATQVATTTITVEDPLEGLTVPGDITTCTSNQSEVFNLTAQTAAILGNLNPEEYAVTYYTSYENAQFGSDAIAQPQAFSSSGQTIYTQVFNLVTGCMLVLDFDLVLLQKPSVVDLPNLSACAPQGTFNLTQQDAIVLNSQPDVTIAYYTTNEDAASGTNPIPAPENYSIPVGSQVIYMRVTGTNGCFTVLSFTITLNPSPIVYQVPDLTVCDNIATPSFDLTQQEEPLSGDQEDITIKYYPSAEDAQAGTNMITAPESFTPPAMPFTVFVSLTNTTGCISYTSFSLTTVAAPVVPSLPQLEACSDSAQAAFNLRTHENLITNGQQSLAIYYYTSAEDAASGTNAIESAENYSNLSNPQTIYVGITNNAGCTTITDFQLMVHPTPAAVALPELTACAPQGTFNLSQQGAIVLNSQPGVNIAYYTNPEDATSGINPIASPENYSIPVGSQVIYMRVTSTNGCFTVLSFTITLNPSPTVYQVPDLTVCDNITTPTFDLTQQEEMLSGGQQGITIKYYPSAEDAQAGTNMITAPESFTPPAMPLTVFVSLTNTAGCISYTSFSLTTVAAPVVPNLPQLEACSDSAQAAFNLQTHENLIINGQQSLAISYYTSAEDAASGNNAIESPENYSNFSNPQTIYVRVTNSAGCITITDFQLMVHPAPVAVALPELTACGTNESAVFNLTVYENELLTGGTTGITYHISQEDAEQGTNLIQDPESFVNSANPQTVYIKLSNAHCSTIIPLQVQTMNSPDIPELTAHTLCSPVNLTALADNNNDADTIQFYSNEEDALNQENAITDSSNFSFDKNTTVFYVVTNTLGCAAIGALQLTEGTCDIPKGISPNGDEKNDTLDLSLLNVAKIQIYNRYGLMVYEQAPYADQWHGQDQHGNDLPVGTYFYSVAFKDGTNKTGWIYINR